ncbi:hypothetical protein [Haloterrigena salinisoli]|uniref:hypothetical protein n=1 Tax=Haloterrigena salinisoli TaxID=3132747 RepID=UPI0030D4693A
MLLSTPVLAGGIAPALGSEGGATATPVDGHADNEISANESIRIDDSLESADDTVEAVVRLEEPTVPDAVPTDDADAYLIDYAEETQEPLLDYADRTSGVSVETEFWVANAVLLTVDTDRIDLETFARFSAVEAVHEKRPALRRDDRWRIGGREHRGVSVEPRSASLRCGGRRRGRPLGPPVGALVRSRRRVAGALDLS